MTGGDKNVDQMRRFAMAADYLRTNGFSTPLLSFAIAGILWQWFPAWQVFTWAALASASQIVMGIVAHWSLKDSENPTHTKAWRQLICVLVFVSGLIFGGAVLAFYVPGERLNNILMVAVAVASLATLAAMTSPDRGLMIAATAPFVVALVLVMGIYETYPYDIILSGMAALYCAVTFVTANKLSSMVGRLVDLQIGNGKLIASLAEEKREADLARIRAENASRAKSNFLANMSHELRTPLNAILGFSEIIRDRSFGDQASPRYSAYAGDIHTSGAHLLALINDILDLSRIEAGKWDLAEEPVNLPEVFDAVLKLTLRHAEVKGIGLSATFNGEDSLFADRKAVLQMLVNLVSNSVKFTPAGGSVAIGAKLEGGGIVLTVSDTGAGIAQTDIPRVLERFGQARHDIAASNHSGVGLGLPIVKGLAEAHGATLTLASELGRGTTVRIAFPPSRTITQNSTAVEAA